MGEAVHVNHGFEPVFDRSCRLLILGSFPSVLSRANDFYYGNPQNRFWRVMARVLDEDVPRTILQKRAMLLSHGIALWDVIESCDIEGSSDASIRNVTPVDIVRVMQLPTPGQNPSKQTNAPIEAVFCNGGTADIAHVMRMPTADPDTRQQRKAPIEAVFCNGGTAARLYRKHLEPITQLPATTLP